MIYEIEKHVPGIENTVLILDDDGEMQYYFDSRLLLNQRLIRLYNADDAYIAKIERVMPSFEPRFRIYIENDLMGELVSEFSHFDPRVRITSEYGPIISKGDILSLNFSLHDVDGQTMAVISEDMTENEDTYGVEIDDLVDDEFILCLLFVIDTLLNE